MRIPRIRPSTDLKSTDHRTTKSTDHRSTGGNAVPAAFACVESGKGRVAPVYSREISKIFLVKFQISDLCKIDRPQIYGGNSVPEAFVCVKSGKGRVAPVYSREISKIFLVKFKISDLWSVGLEVFSSGALECKQVAGQQPRRRVHTDRF